MKVGSIAGERKIRGSTTWRSLRHTAQRWADTKVAGSYSVDDKGTRDERGGMSSGGGEEDEDLGILFCGERGAMLAT